MAAALTARLSRFLVGCHPRRWRQRYADEMLDVLEQHRAGARTVLDLAFSTLDAHLDREWRDWSRLRRMARSAVPYALAATALTVFLGAMVGMAGWRDSHWSPDRTSGVNALVFAPGRPILVSATGFDINGLDTVWGIADPARPRALARFEGGSPTAISPDGRTVATQSFHDQPTLWDVADPARPVHLATLGGHTAQIAAFAFGPGGRLLADVGFDGAVTVFDLAGRGGAVLTAKVHAVPGAFDPADAPENTYTLAFSADGHTLTAIVASNPADPARAAATQTVSRWSLTAAGTAIPAGTVSRDLAPAGQLTVAPGGRFLARGAPPGGDAVSLSVLP
jgi:WD40 repeat protein